MTVKRVYTPGELERIVAKRLKERDTEVWAKAVNGYLQEHTQALVNLREHLGNLSLAIDRLTEDRQSDRKDEAREKTAEAKKQGERRRLIDNRWVRVGIVVTILTQVFGTLYTVFFGLSHAILRGQG